MKRKNYFSLVLFLFISLSVFSQSFEWGGRFGGIGEDVIRAMHVDEDGNSYTTGYFTDTADFDISSNEIDLTSNGFYDVFVQKTNADGVFEWAVSFGSELFDYGTGISTDSQGNVYITGYFDQTIDFDPGPAEFNLTSQGGGDVFILKLDSNGEFVWAKSVGGTGYEESTSIGVDELGNVYVIGYIYETIDFDPGEDEFLVSSQGAADTFLLILNSAGDFVNVYSYGGVEQDLALEIVVKSSAEIILSGFFEGTADLDPRPFNDYLVTASEGAAGYVMQIDASGAITNIANTDGGNITTYTAATDAQNNMYIAGIFDGTVNFDPASGNSEFTLTSSLAFNGFILKVTPEGTVAWARQIAADDSNFIYDIEIGSDATVYATGFFSGTADFDPSPTEEFLLTKESENSSDAFLLVLDGEGIFETVYKFGGANFIDTHQIGLDAEDAIYLSAQFETTVDINPLPGENNDVTALDFRDSYLFKMNNRALSTTDFQTTTMSLYPNPASDVLFLSGMKDLAGKEYIIYNMLGQKVATGILSQDQNIAVHSLEDGVYTLTLSNTDSFRFIKK